MTRASASLTCIAALAAALLGPAPNADTAELAATGTEAPRQAEPSHTACGGAEPCTITGGSYRLQMPTNWDGRTKVGAVIYMHGWQGTAAGAMRFKALTRAVSQAGLAFVAPQGRRKTWSYPGSPSRHRDEFAFFDTLLEDLTRRHAIAPDKLIASGFSMGGSMAWYLACFRGARFAGFVPVAGAFWRPHPADCPSPAPLIVHIHGTADRTVPLGGRPIGSTWHQGDVFEALAYWRRKAQCPPTALPGSAAGYAQRPRPDALIPRLKNQLACAASPGCSVPVMELCLHTGGHSIRAEWITMGIRRIAQARGW